MMLKKETLWILCSIVIVGAIILHCISASCSDLGNQNDPNAVVGDSNSSKKPSRPMIIWWGRTWQNHETMRLALSSGIFSHVMLVNVHEFAGLDHLYEKNVRKAIELCKQKGVEVIWTRWLYPGSKLNGFTLEDAFSAEYYVVQIRNLREEAKQRGVRLVAFDTEPYANKPLKGITRRRLSDEEVESLNKAIDTAVKIAGKVDFVLPAGGQFRKHFYNCTRRLGKFGISEYTYYDIPSMRTKKMAKKRPYDIMGVFVHTTKKNKYNPRLPLFTPKEILERQDLWAHKKGLFIYPGFEKETALVAREFSRIKVIWPLHDSNDVRSHRGYQAQ